MRMDPGHDLFNETLCWALNRNTPNKYHFLYRWPIICRNVFYCANDYFVYWPALLRQYSSPSQEAIWVWWSWSLDTYWKYQHCLTKVELWPKNRLPPNQFYDQCLWDSVLPFYALLCYHVYQLLENTQSKRRSRWNKFSWKNMKNRSNQIKNFQ